jgi:hypothetical protein
MKRILVVALCLVSGLAFAEDKAAPGAGPEGMDCAKMMNSHAVYPAKMAEFMTAMADGLEAHAKWIGTTDKATKGEHDFLIKLAKEHRQFATEFKKTSTEMASVKSFGTVKHDMAKMDAKAGELMGKRIALEREMASMMQKDADESEKMMQAMSQPANKT